MIIAIDGPAGAGKGTLSKKLADYYGFAKLDTGLLYRAVAMKVLCLKGNPDDEALATAQAKKLRLSDINPDALRTEEIGEAASKVSVFPKVRSYLLDFQRNFATCPPNNASGAILDGRDIGSVVCPHADIKLYITASSEVRAERRYKELLSKNNAISFDKILQDIERRDARDIGRDTAPLLATQDACKIDTSDMDVDTVFKTVLDFISTKA